MAAKGRRPGICHNMFLTGVTFALDFSVERTKGNPPLLSVARTGSLYDIKKSEHDSSDFAVTGKWVRAHFITHAACGKP